MERVSDFIAYKFFNTLNLCSILKNLKLIYSVEELFHKVALDYVKTSTVTEKRTGVAGVVLTEGQSKPPTKCCGNTDSS